MHNFVEGLDCIRNDKHEKKFAYIFDLAASFEARCCFTCLYKSSSDSDSPHSMFLSSSLPRVPGPYPTSSPDSTPAPARTRSSCFLRLSPMSSRFGKSSSPEIICQVKSHEQFVMKKQCRRLLAQMHHLHERIDINHCKTTYERYVEQHLTCLNY